MTIKTITLSRTKLWLILTLGTIILLPFLLLAVKNIQDIRSRASEDNLELSLNNSVTEAGLGVLFPIEVDIDTKGLDIALLDFQISYNPKVLQLVTFFSDNVFDTEMSSAEPSQTDLKSGTYHFQALDTFGEKINGKKIVGKFYFRGVSGGQGIININSAVYGKDTSVIKISQLLPTSINIIDPLNKNSDSGNANSHTNSIPPTTISNTAQKTPIATLTPTVIPASRTSVTHTAKTIPSSTPTPKKSEGSIIDKLFHPNSSKTPKAVVIDHSKSATNNHPDTCPTKVMGDANCDGKVNNPDLNVWREEIQNPGTKNSDFNSDGKVDLLDYLIWRKYALKL